MNKIKYVILILGLIAGFGIAIMPASVNAAPTPTSVLDDACNNMTDAEQAADPLCARKNANVMDSIGLIVNTLLYVLGAVAVLMIVIGGIRYTTSQGDAKNVEAAKNTILYSVIGLVVALLAYAIVHFVLGRF